VQTLVGRFVSGSGFVLVRQTFVFGCQAVAIRACLWLSWDRVRRQSLTRPPVCTTGVPGCRRLFCRFVCGVGSRNDLAPPKRGFFAPLYPAQKQVPLGGIDVLSGRQKTDSDSFDILILCRSGDRHSAREIHTSFFQFNGIFN
jgi:hypothetical protein